LFFSSHARLQDTKRNTMDNENIVVWISEKCLRIVCKNSENCGGEKIYIS
jgi:hypothetical protein